MSYRCSNCGTENEREGECVACGAKRKAREPSPLRAITIVGFCVMFAGGLLFFEAYPPGTRVYMTRSRGSYISTAGDLRADVIIAFVGLVIAALGFYLEKKNSRGE